MAEKVNLQHKIQAYRQSNPKLKKLSDNQVLSIMVKNGAITLTAEEKQSILASSKQKDNNTGLQVEKTTKAKPKKTIYLQSGRKVVYSRLADGRTVMQYFGADGTPIKPDYFKKVEGQISIAANGSSYTVTKNGKKRVLKAKNPTQGAIDQNIAKLNNQEKALNKAKKEQGWIGKGWDWIKNTTGIWDGSDKAQQQIDAERKLLNQIKTGKVSKKDFKEVTGLDYTKENLAKFQKGELSQAEEKINGYKEGQDMATDMVGDMVSGIAAVGIYTVAVAAAPVTGGASLLVGFGLATASGAAIKVGVKALDTVGTDKKYTLKDFKHDAATGAFSGGLAPLTAGLGGAVGKTIATKFGVQAIKTVGKEVAEEAAKGGVKSTLKAALANPAGYEYVGGTFAKRTASMAAEMATDGALGGVIDGGFRAGLDSDWDAETMLDGAIEGGIGGAVMAPVIGGGMKALGKGAQKAFGKDNVHINENNKVIRDDVVNDFLAGKVDDKYIAAVLRDVDDLEQAFQVAGIHTKDKVKLAEAKNKILEKVNKNIVDHGSIVLQSKIPASKFLLDSKSGVRYAVADQNDIFLVHAVPEGEEIKSLSYLIDVTNKKSDDAYLSLSLVNKNSSLFGDGTSGLDNSIVKYGIIPINRSNNVTSAGFGQVSCYKKDFSTFVQHQSLGKLQEEYVYLKNSLLKNLKDKGYNLTDKDYIALFNELKNKEFFNEITDDIKIGNKVLKANELRDALETSHVELSAKIMYGQGSNNEVSSLIDGIRAIYARVDNIDDVKPEIKQLAKDNGLDIVLLGKPTRLDIESNPQYQSELKSIEQAFKDGKINMIQRMQQKRKLKTKYEAPEIEKLRARTTAEQKKLIQKQETPIQTQQRLIDELETAKNREDFSRITQEIKNLPKTEEYRAIRQRLGGEYLQRYNEWKANLPESTRAIKNMADDVNSKNVSNVLIKKEDIIAKYCSENGLVTDDILSIFNKYTKNLDDASVERLLELACENKINLFSASKKKSIFILNRNCKNHSLITETKGILNYLKEGDEEAIQLLKELLALEKQGKIKPKNINEMLKLYTYDDEFTEQCRLLAQKLQNGEILDAQIRDAIFFIENEMPLEILNPKNISKYAKDDLREWSLKIQGAKCKGLATETFNALNRELASLVKINKVPVNVLQKFSSQFNSIMNILGNNNFSIEKLAKAGGIKLQYSRDSFKSDIFNEIKHLSPIEQEKILSKFGLSKNSENILGGLPVEISPYGLNDVEQAINNHIHKFLSKENKIVLPKGFEELHPVIESICNAIPEFRFTIQAQQHNVQKYNLAEHMLKAFQENMKNPMYKELSETDKRILGIATLLHDINKIERTKFDQHALPSSQTVNAIVERIPNLTPMEKNRIVNLVKYHHWLTDISEKENPTLVKKLTEVFRGGNDFKLARIFAESDLKAVNDSFYTNYGEKLNYSMINEIEEAILALQSKGRMMFTASVNTERALEKGAKLTTIGKGCETTSNIVIDANQMGLDKEFFAYHGAKEQSLMTVFASGGYGKGLGLSISTGKNGVCKVFKDYEVFAIFDKLDINAIGKVSDGNANTKYGKDIDKILRYMGSDSKFVTKFKEYYPHHITDREYALVFREIQGLELSEVSKNKNIIKILGDTNKALDFEKALEGTNQFFASSVESHNELVAFDLYPTAIGIKCKLENLSFEFRKFLQDNNIVIINNIK